jgi:hypothetical protein
MSSIKFCVCGYAMRIDKLSTEVQGEINASNMEMVWSR